MAARVFSLRRRRGPPAAEMVPPETEVPVYPQRDEAFEYRDARLEPSIAGGESEAPQENLLFRADIKPLPRCPGCSTAVGSSQRTCHTCGFNLGNTL